MYQILYVVLTKIFVIYTHDNVTYATVMKHDQVSGKTTTKFYSIL